VSLMLHSSAEHTLGGGASDAELHLLHTNTADAADMLIIAVQLQAQGTDLADNKVLAAVLGKLTGTTFANEAVPASPYGACVTATELPRVYLFARVCFVECGNGIGVVIVHLCCSSLGSSSLGSSSSFGAARQSQQQCY
jgi:hypothetical protein